ncbi:C40 family peptidase [Aegicerativicinus sediminis]
MQFGICNLGAVAMRVEPNHTCEMLSQLLFGETFKIIDERKLWFKIRSSFDNYEGWISKVQCQVIKEEEYVGLNELSPTYSSDLLDFVTTKSSSELLTVPMGSNLSCLEFLGYQHDGNSINGIQPKSQILKTAFNYLNCPHQWGGKSPLGIDSSGFTQVVYRINGVSLLRDATQQASQGEALSFIEESEPGDLAFFDNNEGQIDHVGIIMADNYVIHSYGKVRIDRIDHSGIYNTDTRMHTHKLRVIKKIF